MNGAPDTWWVKIDEEWVPWLDQMQHRPCWGVNVRQCNTTKIKWGDTQINGHVYVEILCNNKKVYEYGCRDIEYALAKAQTLITELSEHPLCFWDLQREVGRKIYYRDMPAVVHSISYEGTILIKSVNSKPFSTPAWAIDDKDFNPFADDDREVVNEDILSHSISWFRDKLVAGEEQTDKFEYYAEVE
jgi:hypothetical protein